MRRVGLDPERVEDQDVEPFEQRPGLVGDPADVGAIRQVADPEARGPGTGRGRVGPAGSPGRGPGRAAPGPIRSNSILGTPPGGIGLGPVVEGVMERPADRLLGHRPRSRSAPGRRSFLGEHPGVVEPEQVVGVVVRERDRMDLADPLADRVAAASRATCRSAGCPGGVRPARCFSSGYSGGRSTCRPGNRSRSSARRPKSPLPRTTRRRRLDDPCSSKGPPSRRCPIPSTGPLYGQAHPKATEDRPWSRVTGPSCSV